MTFCRLPRGDLQSGCKVSYSTNYGNVGGTAGNYSVGGIVGVTTSATISNCTNNGAVSTSDPDTTDSNQYYPVGGVVGVVTSSKVSDSINNGAISGVDNVGGIAGIISSSSTVEVVKTMVR